MQKTYQGSRHCGTGRFEADLDICTGTGKCNCTISTKMRLWSVNALLKISARWRVRANLRTIAGRTR